MPRPLLRDRVGRSPVLLAVLLALAAAALTLIVTGLVWTQAPDELRVRTDVVGFPTWANFNVYRYFWAYALGMAFFPLATIAIFLGLTRLLAPGLRSTLRARLRGDRDAAADLDGSPPRAALAALSRAAFIGGVLGLAGAAASPGVSRPLWLVALPVAATYTVLVALVAAAVARRWSSTSPFAEATAFLNSIAAPFAVLALYPVSARTSVTVLADGTVHRYPWLPLPLAVGATAVALGFVVLGLRRAAGHDGTFSRVERRALVVLVGPVLLFLLTASIPGELEPVDMFHEGEWLAAADRVREGAFPWRDLFFIHGLLDDVGFALAGWGVFEDSRWGAAAGAAMILNPLYWLSLYALLAYLFRRSLGVLVLAQLAIVLGAVTAVPFVRLGLLPLAMLAFAALLQAATPVRAAAFGLIGTVQSIVTPEAIPLVLCLFAALAGFELWGFEERRGVLRGFRRTLLATGFAAALATAWIVFLASRGALDDFVFYFRTFLPDHELTGALPILAGDIPVDVPRPALWFAAAAPVALVTLGTWYFAASVWLRRAPSVDDWMVGAAALGAAFYYQKFVARADEHVLQVYTVAVPVLLYVGYRTLALVELAVARLLRARPSHVLPRAVVLAAGLALVLVGSQRSLHDAVRAVPGNFHARAAEPSPLDRLGFVEPEVEDAAVVRDLAAALDAYLEDGEALFDFTNSPALFHYFLRRPPSTRYYHVSMAIRERTQRDLVAKLEEERPRLVVFSAEGFGLLVWDYIPNQVRHYLVSEYVLREYEPLAEVRGFVFLLRRGEDVRDTSALARSRAGDGGARDLYFRTPPCDWGHAPRFLASAPKRNTADGVSLSLAQEEPLARFSGWAADPAATAPAREVLAVVGDTVIGRTNPGGDRPDIVPVLDSAAFRRSGFSVVVPIRAIERAGGRGLEAVRVFGVSRDGLATELEYGAAVSRGRERRPLERLRKADGRSLRVVPGRVTGFLDVGEVLPPVVKVRPPANSDPSRLAWLEIEPAKPDAAATYVVSDTFEDPLREILGRGLPGQRVVRMRVASCSQWRGYRDRGFYIVSSTGRPIRAARLVPDGR